MHLSEKYIKNGSLFYFLIIAYVAIISILINKSGLLYFTDTVSYLEMADRINKGEFPHSSSFSPAYPFIIYFISKIFSISDIKSLYVINILLTIISTYFLYLIISTFNKSSKNHLHQNLFIAFILMINWLVVKIILTAHADILFFLFLTIYFLLLLKWIQNFEIKWLMIITIIASLSIWVKYNSIILVPFLLLASWLYGRKKINYFILLVPVIFVIVSYYLFKTVNGTVIEHFQGDSVIVKLKKSFSNLALFYTNYTSSGLVFFSSIFSKSIELLIPHFMGFVFMSLVIYLFIKTYLLGSGINRIENIFLLFSLYYWFCFFSLCQFTEWEEMNSRTLFPAILSFLIWLSISFKHFQKTTSYLISTIAILSVCYSYLYLSILINSDHKKFISYFVNFEKKPAVLQLIKITENKNTQYQVYSNESRNLSYALKFKKVKNLPAKKIFAKGKFREQNEQDFEKNNLSFYNEFISQNSVLLLIDHTNFTKTDSLLISKATAVYRLNKDILIVSSIR